MKSKLSLSRTSKAGLVIGALTLGTLVAPATYAQINIGVNIPVPQVNVSVAPDDYVYYPTYGVYYSPKRHMYGWERNGSWAWEAKPPGVSGEVVLGSPSVRMDFHDSPEHHYRDIVKQYPRDWKPRQEVRHEESRHDAIHHDDFHHDDRR